MKGALVTGATTPFGRAVVGGLLARSDVTSVLAVGREAQWPDAADAADPRFSYLAIDLTRSRELRDLLFGPARDLGIDAVLHGAHHRSIRAHGKSAHALHVDATREMLRLSERHPTIQRFVYASSAEVYRNDAELPALIAEDHPIEMAPEMPQRLRDRVEADLTVCTRMGMSSTSMAVLRFAEVFAPDCGSQLADYLASRICFRPIGFDPMIEVISVADAARAAIVALASTAHGIFNVPGADVLPLSAAITAADRIGVPIPGGAIGPLYAARAAARGTEFDWTLNRWRFRWSGVLDGTRAKEILGYEPEHRVAFRHGALGTHAVGARAVSRGTGSRTADLRGTPGP